jgi:hypothetical protein
MSSQSRKKWCCLQCSQRSARRWNLKVHIKRRHNGIGEPIDEEKSNEIKDMMSNQFAYHNHPYSVNDLTLRSGKGKEKEQDIIDVMYEIVIERKEKLRKIKEIKSFFNELYSLSSSSQQPVTSLIQTPIIQPIIPSIITTAPLQPTPPQPTQSSQEQGQKKIIIYPGTDLITNLFITSTLIVPELVRRLRGVGKGGEDSIITIPQEPSLPPCMRTTIFRNNNDSKKRGELNPITENTKEQELEEDRDDIEKHSLSEPNLLIDDQDDDDDGGGVDHVYSDYDDGEKWVRKKIIHGDINDTY